MQDTKLDSPQTIDPDEKVWIKTALKDLNCNLDDIHSGPGFSADGGSISNSMS